jgi:hypothetical protein
MDDVKMDIEEILWENVDWIDTAQDKGKCSVYCRQVSERLACIKCQEFPMLLRIVSCSWRTLLHGRILLDIFRPSLEICPKFNTEYICMIFSNYNFIEIGCSKCHSLIHSIKWILPYFPHILFSLCPVQRRSYSWQFINPLCIINICAVEYILGHKWIYVHSTYQRIVKSDIL